MNEPRISAQENGDLHISRLEIPFADTLHSLPKIIKLAGTDPRARKRLLPDAYDKEEQNEDWRKHCTPELEHLFRSAGELVSGDIAKMERDPLRPRTWRLVIAKNHLMAWISTLNAARLALGEIHRVTEKDMEDYGPVDPASARDAAILTIRLLGWMEELLLKQVPL